jgi:hypothetical protein
VSRKEKAKQVTRAIKSYARDHQLLDANAIRVIIALERVIARLVSYEPLANHIIFKGGFVLLKTTPSLRFTRDADILASKINKDVLIGNIKRALNQDLDDGLWYGDVEIIDLPLQGKYGACRLRFPFQIGDPKKGKDHKLSRVHIDIGFSDKLLIQPEEQKLEAILDYENAISWKIYPLEFTLAEKLHAFCERGSGNSRAKDLYDITLIFSLCSNKSDMKNAIVKTFENRDLKLPQSLFSFAKSMNLTTLKSAWTNVFVLNNKPNFDDLWKKLLKTLKEIDEILIM